MKKYTSSICTLVLVFLCIAMFLVESFMGGSQNTATLVKLGAMNNYAVVAGGQWWRLFTAQFLHIGILHLVSNIVMIYYMGLIIEPLFGHWRFLSIYLLSGIGGNLLSLAFGSDKSISAGASTALFGLFGAVLTLGLRYRNNPMIAYIARQALALAVINLLLDIFMLNIDIFGHIGGLLAGFIVAGLVGDCSKNKYDMKWRVLAGACLILYVVLTIRQGMVINF